MNLLDFAMIFLQSSWDQRHDSFEPPLIDARNITCVNSVVDVVVIAKKILLLEAHSRLMFLGKKFISNSCKTG